MSSIERGFYSSSLEPLLRLNLHVIEDEYLEIDALVDTGFNRSLLIFETHAWMAKLPPTLNLASRVCLANGQLCWATSTYGYVRWFSKLSEVEILVVHGPPGLRDRCLIGMELLRGKELIMGETGFEVRAP